MKGYIVPHLISMKIQIWKFENDFGLATFYGYLLKNMSCDLFQGFVGLGYNCAQIVSGTLY